MRHSQLPLVYLPDDAVRWRCRTQAEYHDTVVLAVCGMRRCDFMLNLYGIKSLAMQNLANFVQTVTKHSAEGEDFDPRIHVFGRLSGILSPFDYRTIPVSKSTQPSPGRIRAFAGGALQYCCSSCCAADRAVDGAGQFCAGFSPPFL